MIAKTTTKQNGKGRPPLKVRHEPPTVDEAVFAAQGLTQDIEQQSEFVAELAGLEIEEAKALVLKAAAKPATSNRVFVPARSGLQRAVVIETTGRSSRNRASSSSDAGPPRPAGRLGLRSRRPEVSRAPYSS